MYCIYCGRRLPDEALFCCECGHSQAQQNTDDTKSSLPLIVSSLLQSPRLPIERDEVALKAREFNIEDAPSVESADSDSDNISPNDVPIKTQVQIGKIEPEITYEEINPNLRIQIKLYKTTNLSYKAYCLTDGKNNVISKQYDYMAPLPPSFKRTRHRNIKWCKVGNEDKYGLMILHLRKGGKPKVQEIPCIFEAVNVLYKVNNETVYVDGHPFNVKSEFAINVKYNSSNCILLLPSGKLYCIENQKFVLIFCMALFISVAVVLIAALAIGLLDAFFLPIPVKMRLLIIVACGITSFLIVAMQMAGVKELCEIKY